MNMQSIIAPLIKVADALHHTNAALGRAAVYGVQCVPALATRALRTLGWTSLEEASFPPCQILRNKPVPFNVLADMEVSLRNLRDSICDGEVDAYNGIKHCHRIMTVLRREGYSPTGAIAYYETVSADRVGPFAIDLTQYEGEETERLKSIANLHACFKELSRLRNPFVQYLASHGTKVLLALDAERQAFIQDHVESFGYPPEPRTERPGS